jgi:ABC-type sugar transport system permease subunit
MQIFDIPYILTWYPMMMVPPRGEATKTLTTLVYYMWNNAFGYANARMGYAAAVSYMMFLLLAVFSFIFVILKQTKKGAVFFQKQPFLM